MTKQSQKSGDYSANIQAENIVVQGLSYAEVKEVALDVFRNNFYLLGQVAHDTAQKRAEEITESFLTKLQKENPQGFANAQDPDFQHSLFTIQKEHAKIGDKNLGDLLVDLLVDRSKHSQRNLLQIVLNESLKTAPKLTADQLSALSIIFIFRYTKNNGVNSHNNLGIYFDNFALPFLDNLCNSDSCYQHLDYSGCGSIELSSINLEGALLINYKGLFSKGFTPEEIETRKIENKPGVFIKCINNPDAIQVNALNENSLKNSDIFKSLSKQNQDSIVELFSQNIMSEEEVKNRCIETRPYMQKLFDIWSSSAMKSFTLTSVGIAIGHANVKRLTGEFSDLTIWIK